ncbi:hypothetical protein ACFPRL_09645 [Pseudoclavibacter helvolus]
MQQLNYVRNRAAHHEPVHARDLRRDRRLALDLAGWIAEDAREWITDVSSLSNVIAQRPSTAVER